MTGGLLLLAVLALTARTGIVDLPPGETRLSAAAAARQTLFISNHDYVPARAVVFPIVGATNLTIRGHGSRLVVDGEAIAFMIRDSRNVTIEGLELDWTVPSCREAVITAIRDGETRFRMVDPYRTQGVSMIRLFRGDTREMLPGAGEVCLPADAMFTEEEGVLKHDFSKDGAGARVGDILAFRKRNPDRPCPAVFVENSKDVVLKDFVIHTADGMGLLAQVSENVTWSGGGVWPRDGHYASTQADATHFSNVKGRVLVENCRFEGMMDDAINVHSTCVRVENVDAESSPRHVRVRFMHGQAYGFELFHPGDVVRFLRADTLDAAGEATVRRVARESDRVVTLEVAVRQSNGFVGEASCLPMVRQDAAPTGENADRKISYVLENATYQCAVTFRNNRVLRNRARGALFTTPHPVRIESNVFERVTGAALLFSGDAGSWYESGSCRDVVIRGNVFRDCMFAVSDRSLSKAVISFNPVVENPAAEKTRYHRNITIADNVFDMFPAPLLYASCVSNLTFAGNAVRANADYPPRRDARPFIVKDSESVRLPATKLEDM